MSNAATEDGQAPAGGDALIVFTPSGRRGRFAQGTTVLDAARSLGVDIDSVCGGRGICGRCQVSQGIGSFPKLGSARARTISRRRASSRRPTAGSTGWLRTGA